ncbi:extensin-like [Glycine soja]|uniref:extensin-like n=1 Tax=Glycine soja TaxID=3848 RepID=UPI00103CC773|nr:extensin-like [Glycine soja]
MADVEPLDASLDRLEAAMANLAAMDSDLHASHLRLDALHASMLFKLDLISQQLDTVIFRQRFPFPASMPPPQPSLSPPLLFPSSAQPPSPPLSPPPLFPSSAPSPAPPPRPHVPPPQFTPHSYDPPQLYPQEWGNPNSPRQPVLPHSYVPPPLPLQPSIPCSPSKPSSPAPKSASLPMAAYFGRSIRQSRILELPASTYFRRRQQTRLSFLSFSPSHSSDDQRNVPKHGLWLCLSQALSCNRRPRRRSHRRPSSSCSVAHRRQRPPPHPPPPPPKPPPPPSSLPPSLTQPLMVPRCGPHTHSFPRPFSLWHGSHTRLLIQTLILLGPTSPQPKSLP